MQNAGKLKWEGGRLILEIDVTLRVPLQVEPLVRMAIDDIKMTPRESQALDGILKGWQNKEIASAMGVSTRTAKAHVGTLLQKFEVHSRAELAARFSKTRRANDE